MTWSNYRFKLERWSYEHKCWVRLASYQTPQLKAIDAKAADMGECELQLVNDATGEVVAEWCDGVRTMRRTA